MGVMGGSEHFLVCGSRAVCEFLSYTIVSVKTVKQAAPNGSGERCVCLAGVTATLDTGFTVLLMWQDFELRECIFHDVT